MTQVSHLLITPPDATSLVRAVILGPAVWLVGSFTRWVTSGRARQTAYTHVPVLPARVARRRVDRGPDLRRRRSESGGERAGPPNHRRRVVRARLLRATALVSQFAIRETMTPSTLTWVSNGVLLMVLLGDSMLERRGATHSSGTATAG